MNTLIQAKDLSVEFPIGKGLFNKFVLKAVDGVLVQIEKGSFFGLVGESGSGKTTLGRALLKAAPISSGSARYTDGEVDLDLTQLSGAELKDYRKRAQLIFQAPYAALSPRMTVRDIIAYRGAWACGSPRAQDLLRSTGPDTSPTPCRQSEPPHPDHG